MTVELDDSKTRQRAVWDAGDYSALSEHATPRPRRARRAELRQRHDHRLERLSLQSAKGPPRSRRSPKDRRGTHSACGRRGDCHRDAPVSSQR